MKNWTVKKVDLWHLEEELNAFSKQMWDVYQINYLGRYGIEEMYSVICYQYDNMGDGRKMGSGKLTLKDVPPPQEANMI